MTVFGDLETSVLDQLPAGRSPDRQPCRAGRGQAALPRPRLGAGPRGGRGRPPGVRGLPPDRRRGRDADEGRPAKEAAPTGPEDDGRAQRPPLAVLDVAEQLADGPAARAAGRGAARPDGARRQGRRDAPLRRGRDGRPGRDHGHRGRGQRPQRHRDGDHGRRPVRRLPAAPAARPGRPRHAPPACACWSPRRPRRARPAPGSTRSPRTLDGFELSRIDLEQRREGDVLGQAQSGARSSLRMLTVIDDEEVIAAAREEATALVAADPDLDRLPGPAHRPGRRCSTRTARSTWTRAEDGPRARGR